MVYRKEHSKWRERCRKRSQSRTPFHLSGKGRMELIEIAKANAAKSLGRANLDLPASLRTVPIAKETNCGTAVPNAAKFESSDNETDNEYNTCASMTQTLPKKKAKRLCYFNDRWKDTYNWIREKWKETDSLDMCLQDGCHCCQP
ncbi:arginine/serine-rich protein 1-like isoform X2 [Microcebus murinus]|uniref:arginine/serine-rich protein 1-like isoform X2 n=1 Tax=Microcebus murinus TaxID=30608 RepID=UPI000642D7D7|nr:arginine/serine-rich protein 1-like isoform X4 [Microcebus murinus]